MSMVMTIIIAVMLDHYVLALPGGKWLAESRTTDWMEEYLTRGINLLERMGIKQALLQVSSLYLAGWLFLWLLKLLFGALFGIIGSLLFCAVVLFYLLGNEVGDNRSTPFVVAHEEKFGVLFWFALLGVCGMGWALGGGLLYWFVVRCEHSEVINQTGNAALLAAINRVHALAAWIPARVTGFVYALVGNFAAGFNCWISCVVNLKMPSSQVLLDCGRAAVDKVSEDDQQLVNRAFVAWVVLSILIVILL